MLDIPTERYTAIFAIARIVGWSVHRIEELICMDKIIRPVYMGVMKEMEDKMEDKINVKQFIEYIEKRPLMYMEEKDVTYLNYIIRGFIWSRAVLQYKCDIDNKFNSEFGPWLRKWIKKNFEKECDNVFIDWHRMLESVTNTKNEAYKLFFVAFREFFKEEGF